MIPNLPSNISVAFILTALLSVFLFYNAVEGSTLSNAKRRAGVFLLISFVWMGLQTFLSLKGFYKTHIDSLPPRFPLLVMPPVFFIVILFLSRGGRNFIDSLPMDKLTLVHLVRLPVELVLYGLFLNKAVPELMTFAGRNFDILAGITAPLIAWYGIQKKKLSRGILLSWNFISLALLLNIVINAALSVPFPFQQFAFDQPNIAVLNFPFSLLPSYVVPVVLFSHLACIRQLMKPSVLL
jgi:hypothetical protein